MSVLNYARNNTVPGILIALTLILLVSPALLFLGFWLLGVAPALVLKSYLGLLVLTLWLVFMTGV